MLQNKREQVALLAVVVLFASMGSSSTEPTLRLFHNSTNNYFGLDGTVQVYKNFSWNFVNGSDWDFRDAMVVCRNLGFRGVANFSNSTTNFTMPLPVPGQRAKRKVKLSSFVPTILSAIECLGKEEKVSKCILGGVKDVFSVLSSQNFTFRAPPPGSIVPIPNVGRVSCTGFQTVRLIGGSGPHEGRVEVFYNDTWGSVCDDYWEKKDADVLCKQLGYKGSLSALGEGAFGVGASSERIWIDNLNCVGNETDLMLCNRSKWGEHNCLHYEDAAAICNLPTNCNILPTISHGLMSTNKTAVATHVNFTCDAGYVKLGNEQLTCLPTGQWNSRVPLCLKQALLSPMAQRCSSLPDIAFGTQSTSDTSIGSQVQFSCNAGYVLVGHGRITCTQMGLWNGMPPVCFPNQRNFCPKLPVVTNGKASTVTTAVNTEVRFNCDPGFMMVGYSTIHCIMMGHWVQWNGAPPHCYKNSTYVRDSGNNFMSGSQTQKTEKTVSLTGKATAAIFGSLGALVLLVVISVVVIAVILVYKRSEKKKRERNTHIEELSLPLVNTSDYTAADQSRK